MVNSEVIFFLIFFLPKNSLLFLNLPLIHVTMCSSLHTEQIDECFPETHFEMENFWKTSNLFQADEFPSSPAPSDLKEMGEQGKE